MAAGWDCVEELELVTAGEEHVSDDGTVVTNEAAPER